MLNFGASKPRVRGGPGPPGPPPGSAPGGIYVINTVDLADAYFSTDPLNRKGMPGYFRQIQSTT